MKMKIPQIKKPFLFPPQIKLNLKPQTHLKEKEMEILSVKKIANDYLQMKREGKMPDGYARSLMIEAVPDKCMVVHRSMLEDYAKSNPAQQALILTNKYVQKLLKALSINSTSLKYKKIQAEEIWSDLSTKRLNFTLDTYLAFLKCFTLVEDKLMVEKVHDMLVRKQSKMPWSRNVYAGLIAAHHSFGNKYAIKRLFESYEKQFSPLNKFGFLDPVDSEVNNQLKIMLSHYFNALIVAGNHDYFAILLDKLSRMVAEDMYRLLNEDSYKSIFESLKFTGNVEMASRYFKVMRYHHESIPLEYTVFYHALDCISTISGFRETRLVYNILNNIRAEAVLESNIKKNINYTPQEITEMFLEYITTSKQRPELEKFRDWKASLPPLPIQTMMAYSLGKTLDITLIQNFFTKSILTKEYLLLYWSRHLSTHLKNLNNLLYKTQSEMDAYSDSNDLVSKSKNELRSTISWINKKKKRGLTLLYGQTGPLSHVYTALINGWQNALKSSDNNDGLDPLEFDSLLQEMEGLEKDLVLKSEIGKFFNLKNVVEDADGVVDELLVGSSTQ